MDKLKLFGDHRGGNNPPPPPTSSPPRPTSSEGYSVKEEDEDDAEVMQVVANGPPQVSLRTKKQRIVEVNGVLSTEDDGIVERPMSWEGELSDDELMEPRHTPPPPQIARCHNVLPTVISTTNVPGRTLGSPMCMDDERHVNSIIRVKVKDRFCFYFNENLDQLDFYNFYIRVFPRQVDHFSVISHLTMFNFNEI